MQWSIAPVFDPLVGDIIPAEKIVQVNYRDRAHGVGRVVGALDSEAGFAGSMLN